VRREKQGVEKEEDNHAQRPEGVCYYVYSSGSGITFFFSLFFELPSNRDLGRHRQTDGHRKTQIRRRKLPSVAGLGVTTGIEGAGKN